MWSSEPRTLAGLLAPLLLAACTPSYKQYDLLDQPLTCDDGNRLAYRTLTAMRFEIGALHPAAPGQPGSVSGSRPRSPGSDERQDVTVTIDCQPHGVTLLASEGAGLVQQADFKRAFHHAFVNVRATRDSDAALDAQMAAGTAPASLQRRDLRVVVQPMPGQASKLDFPFDLEAGGVLPVRLDVTNLSARTYTLAIEDIRLSGADRQRSAALTPSAAAARIALTAAVAEPDVAASLARQQFDATDIGPGTRRSGYLYFPLANYVAARVPFVDRESGEAEGVRVEF